MHTSLNSIPFELDEKTKTLSVLDSKQFMNVQPLWDNMTSTTDSVVILDRLVYQEESDIDVDGDSLHSVEQQHNPFEFHFEFGSKRPPTVVPEQSEDEPDVTHDALTTYETITDNIYIGSATGRSMAQESMPCECKIESDLDDVVMACGLDNYCINRMMFMECIVEDCPSGRLCQNRRFQLHKYANVNVMLTEKKGYGLRALEDLPTNTFIMEYIGEVIPQSEFIRRTREYDTEGYKHYYFMTLKNDEIIDATKKGCLARFMNHSCNPNCVTQKWVIGKKMRIGIFTNRFVEAGEELTFDYKFERYGAVAQKCYCGESNCKGFIGVDEKKEPEDNLKYDDDHYTVGCSSSSDDEYYYYEDDIVNNEFARNNNEDDEEEEDVDIVTTAHAYRPLQNTNKVHSFVKRMLDSVGKPRLVNKLLMRLKATNPDNSRGRVILKTIIRLHGLKMLKFWLGEWKHNEIIVKKVLEVLEMLPLANKNGLEDCKMLEVLQKLIEHDNDQISQLAEKLLRDWSKLKAVYRIPKRVNQVPESIQHSSSSLSPCKYAKKTIVDLKKEEIMDDEVEEDKKTIHMPSSIYEQKVKKTCSLAGKKRRYESTREFFDPDKDYFEYLSMKTITTDELEWIMKYPPRPIIPTAPRAMLEHQQEKNTSIYYHDTHKHTYQHYKYHKHQKTQQQQQQQQQQEKELEQQPQKCTSQSQQTEYPTYEGYYAYNTTAADYYSLPPNWGATTTEDGFVYYYNVQTGETQWDVPLNHDNATVLADTAPSSSTTLEKAPIGTVSTVCSTEMIPTSSTSSSCISTLTSSLLSSSNSLSSPSATAARSIQLPTPMTSTNSSVDADDDYLSEIELKMEVGKVVTKYLSTMKTTLWNNDKPLFKHLARKATHYIVNKNVELGKRIKRIDSCERTKIETFMNEFVPEYFTNR